MHSLSRLFYTLFEGRRDTYALQKIDAKGKVYYWRVFGKELTQETLSDHLEGKDIVGIYPLMPGGVCKFAAVDVDCADINIARHAQKALPQPNYLERSRGGNHHIWMFFHRETSVTELEKLCRETIVTVKREVGCHCNLYPSPTTSALGVLIALPLQGNATKGNATFLNEDGEPIPAEELKSFLQRIKYTKLRRGVAPTAKELFLSEGKVDGDKSRSGYDFTLAQSLLAKDLPPDLAREILLGKPEGTIHSQDEEYLKRTLQKAERVETTQEIPTRSWNDIIPVVREEFFTRLSEKLIIGAEQRQQLDIFYAAIIANLKTSGRPIWLLIVGPPGCGKTMPMSAIQHSPFTYACSSFRPTALISGWGTKGGQDMSLLPKLNGKILMVKDMSSLLSQNKDVVLEIMGLLRDAYDGYCSRVYGTGVERSYRSRFGFIGAATPDIDMHWSLNVRLGERFLRLRVSSTLDQIYGKIDLTLDNIKEEDNVDNTLEEVSLGYLKYLTRDKADLPALAMQKAIGRLAQLGAILRTSVARHAYSRQILVIPEWEEATRYAKQLAKVAMSLAFLRDKEANDEEEMEDLKKLVRSCIDAKMEKLYAAIAKYPNSTTTKLSELMGIPSSMIRSWLDDLIIARIIMYKRDGYEHRWQFVPLLAGMIKQFKLW